MKTYTLRCGCEFEGRGENKLAECKKAAKQHLKTSKNPKCQEVFIDEYDEVAGELSGKYWKIKK